MVKFHVIDIDIISYLKLLFLIKYEIMHYIKKRKFKMLDHFLSTLDGYNFIISTIQILTKTKIKKKNLILRKYFSLHFKIKFL
jgi:hypothetical protein